MRIQGWSVVAALLLAGTACGGKNKPAQAPTAEVKPAKTGSGDQHRKAGDDSVAAEVTDADNKQVSFGAIYFEFDSFELTEPSKQALEQVADYLKKNPGSRITIGGHTDERGTPEYNLALGDKRARVAKEFVVRLGGGEDQVRTITYGEERPAAQGEDEASWSQNRRDEFEIVPKKQ